MLALMLVVLLLVYVQRVYIPDGLPLFVHRSMYFLLSGSVYLFPVQSSRAVVGKLCVGL